MIWDCHLIAFVIADIPLDTAFQWSHIASSGTTLRSNYAYAGHLDDVDSPTFDLSFGVPREVNYNPTRYTANNLYNKYWRDYIEQIADKDSKLFVGYFYLNEFDVQSLDFRDSFFFENEVWRLNKIIESLLKDPNAIGTVVE